MGLKDFVKKSLTGATDEENRENREKMRRIFNEKVESGSDYTILYCHNNNYTDALLVKITRHSNYIVGYKTNNRTIVVIPVSASLDDAGDAMSFSKDNGGSAQSSMGYCLVGNNEVAFQLEPITYEPGVNRGSKHCVAVVQTNQEVSAFKKFCKEGL